MPTSRRRSRTWGQRPGTDVCAGQRALREAPLRLGTDAVLPSPCAGKALRGRIDGRGHKPLPYGGGRGVDARRARSPDRSAGKASARIGGRFMKRPYGWGRTSARNAGGASRPYGGIGQNAELFVGADRDEIRAGRRNNRNPAGGAVFALRRTMAASSVFPAGALPVAPALFSASFAGGGFDVPWKESARDPSGWKIKAHHAKVFRSFQRAKRSHFREDSPVFSKKREKRKQYAARQLVFDFRSGKMISSEPFVMNRQNCVFRARFRLGCAVFIFPENAR